MKPSLFTTVIFTVLTLGAMCRNPRRKLALIMITPHQTPIIKLHRRSLRFSSSGRSNWWIGWRGAADVGDRLRAVVVYGDGGGSGAAAKAPVFSLWSALAAPHVFPSCPLQEMQQQPFVKEPYGINLGALPADKDLLIYERWWRRSSNWNQWRFFFFAVTFEFLLSAHRTVLWQWLVVSTGRCVTSSCGDNSKAPSALLWSETSF